LIVLRDVVKMYGNKLAVDHLSFSISQGELFGFLGPNGAGKTTTLKMMIGLLKPSEGEIWINDSNVWQNRKAIHKEIGVVFELPNLYNRSSIKANLALFADLYGVKKSRILDVMEELQLVEKQNEKVGELSKGWKQRVLIARALLHKPKVLFLDEPTSGLDPNTATLIRNYIKTIKNQGATIILTTHDMNEADELSDRVGIMYQGVLAAIDTTENLKSQYSKKELYIEFLRDGHIVKQNLPMGTEETEQFVSKLMSEGKIININTKANSLTDVFATLTGGVLS
jgi:ABC-2 type transport system ATP-binding protein